MNRAFPAGGSRRGAWIFECCGGSLWDTCITGWGGRGGGRGEQKINANRDSGYADKWSDWLGAHSQTITMKVGDKLDGEGFSSDELVVSDSLEAMAAGRATVLVGEEICFITVQ